VASVHSNRPLSLPDLKPSPPRSPLPSLLVLLCYISLLHSCVHCKMQGYHGLASGQSVAAAPELLLDGNLHLPPPDSLLSSTSLSVSLSCSSLRLLLHHFPKWPNNSFHLKSFTSHTVCPPCVVQSSATAGGGSVKVPCGVRRAALSRRFDPFLPPSCVPHISPQLSSRNHGFSPS